MLPRTKLYARKKLKAMAKAAVVSSLIAFVLFAALEISGLHDFSRLSIFAFFFLCIVLGLRFMYQKKRFLLWLRHFQERHPRQLRLGVLLFMCSELFVPITLQDSSFSRSIGSAFYRLSDRYLSLFMLGMPLFLFNFVLLVFVCAWLNLQEIPLIIFIALPLLLSFGPVITYLYIKRKPYGLSGCYLLSVDSPISQVDSIIKQPSNRDANSIVIQCPDEVWREVVMFLFDWSSVVLIDVSELTENLMWEIETSLTKKHLEEIIITCGIKTGALQQLPRSIHEKLKNIEGMNELSRLRVFYYPAEHPPLVWKHIKLYWTLSRMLREELLFSDFHELSP